MTLAEIAGRFENARQTSASEWEAACPSHDDRTASLCIGQGDDGKILLKCQANCATADVIAAVGLEWRDLFPDNNSNGHAGNGSANRPPASGKKKGRFDCAYDYRDESGRLISQAVRFADPKGFTQRKPKEGGGWDYSVRGVRPVVYRLQELIKADPSELIFVVEGEKDVEALAATGLVATTNAMGAGKWRKEHAEFLRGRHVVVLPDNDQPGRDHAQQVARSLQGKAASIRILALDGLAEKGDVSDWLGGSGTPDELYDLALAAPKWAPPADQPEALHLSNGHIDLTAADGQNDVANGRRLAQQFGAEIRWLDLWKKFIVWDSKRWAIDNTLRVDAFARQVYDGLWAEFAGTVGNMDAKEARQAVAFIKGTGSARGIEAMIKRVRSEAGIPMMPDVLDQHPDLLNLASGTFDLRTMAERPHNRGDWLTQLCPVTLDANAAAPVWEAFIDRIFASNVELIDYFAGPSATRSAATFPSTRSFSATAGAATAKALSSICSASWPATITPARHRRTCCY